MREKRREDRDHILRESGYQRSDGKELSGQNTVVAKFATTASDGKKYMVEHYNLDVIISVGYRVKSKRYSRIRKHTRFLLNDEKGVF